MEYRSNETFEIRKVDRSNYREINRWANPSEAIIGMTVSIDGGYFSARKCVEVGGKKIISPATEYRGSSPIDTDSFYISKTEHGMFSAISRNEFENYYEKVEE